MKDLGFLSEHALVSMLVAITGETARERREIKDITTELRHRRKQQNKATRNAKT